MRPTPTRILSPASHAARALRIAAAVCSLGLIGVLPAAAQTIRTATFSTQRIGNLYEQVDQNGKVQILADSGLPVRFTELTGATGPNAAILNFTKFDNTSTGQFAGARLLSATVTYRLLILSDLRVNNESPGGASGEVLITTRFNITDVLSGAVDFQGGATTGELIDPTAPVEERYTPDNILSGTPFTLQGDTSAADADAEFAATANAQTLPGDQQRLQLSASSNEFGPTEIDFLEDDPAIQAFIGAGSIDKAVDTDTDLTFATAGGNFQGVQTTRVTVWGSVVYQYTLASTNTPEPGTAALLLPGIVGAAVAARRRRRA